MGERRMISKKIICSDLFMEMPHSSQALYFHLIQMADDDGFVGNPRSIQRALRVSDDDFKILLAKKFLYLFQSGVVVILHWGIHNYIQNDRYVPTQYAQEYSILMNDETATYYPNCCLSMRKKKSPPALYPSCIHSVSTREDKKREDNTNIIHTHYITDQGETKNESENQYSAENPVEKCENVDNYVENDVENCCAVENHVKIQYDIPSLQEVVDFVGENQFCVDPKRFYDYYEKRGWKMANGDPIAWRLKIIKWDADEKGERRFEKSGKRSGKG